MKKFTYRYIPQNSKVYAISKVISPKQTAIFRSQVYTEPYMGSDCMARNAVLAYQNESMCAMKLRMLMYENDIEDIEFFELPLIDLQGYCDYIAMPLTVVVNTHCERETRDECCEVYFYEGRIKHDEEFDCKKLK